MPGRQCSRLTIPIWILLAGTIKRLHDRDRSGWWIIPFLVLPDISGNLTDWLGDSILVMPLVLPRLFSAFWGFFELSILRGSPRTNRFGPNPLGKQRATSGVNTFEASTARAGSTDRGAVRAAQSRCSAGYNPSEVRSLCRRVPQVNASRPESGRPACSHVSCTSTVCLTPPLAAPGFSSPRNPISCCRMIRFGVRHDAVDQFLHVGTSWIRPTTIPQLQAPASISPSIMTLGRRRRPPR